ncbi:hypothetical protein POM88_039810 [Heracleum sosnowskyi]|uniref:Uncharacterized protein n=1 Tax=Heracleum sosnowskyi TaxID=360622 RepID=A0AAD8M971_9APIA|nr:hypothetical protein POM88_039810 [Heracleum sosnowskyi]
MQEQWLRQVHHSRDIAPLHQALVTAIGPSAATSVSQSSQSPTFPSHNTNNNNNNNGNKGRAGWRNNRGCSRGRGNRGNLNNSTSHSSQQYSNIPTNFSANLRNSQPNGNILLSCFGIAKTNAPSYANSSNVVNIMSSLVVFQLCFNPGHTTPYCPHYFPAITGKGLYPSAPPALTVVQCGETNNTIWYPDSGAASHMTPSEGLLSSKNAYSGQTRVIVGNEQQLPIKNAGTAPLLHRIDKAYRHPDVFVSKGSVAAMD